MKKVVLTSSSRLKFASTAQFATLLSSDVGVLACATVFAFRRCHSVLVLSGITEGTRSQTNRRTFFSCFTICASTLISLSVVLSLLAIVARHWKCVGLIFPQLARLTKNSAVLALIFSSNTSITRCLTSWYLGRSSITIVTCWLTSCCACCLKSKEVIKPKKKQKEKKKKRKKEKKKKMRNRNYSTQMFTVQKAYLVEFDPSSNYYMRSFAWLPKISRLHILYMTCPWMCLYFDMSQLDMVHR